MLSLRDDIRSKGVLVSDGAWGTFLFAAGMKMGECPELWCVSHPDVVRGIAEKYFAAGADMVLTNSFGGTRFKLKSFGLQERAGELNEAAARLSREAAGPGRHVVGSMGPTGKILMMGDVTEQELYDAFAEQAQALERGGANAVDIETMSALDEACAAVRAVREKTQLEVVCTMTFDTKTADGYRTMMGVSPEQMVAATLDAGAHVIGANCSLGSDEMIDLVQRMRELAPDNVPILVHPNAGQPQQQDDGSILYPETPEMMAANVPRLIAAGATIIGGCCGTGPDHIRAIRLAVDAVTAR